MTFLRLLLLLACCVTAQVHAAEQPATTAVPASDGAGDYVIYCAVCHGSSGAGDGPLAPGLTVPPPDLRSLRFLGGGIFPRNRVTEMIDGREMIMFHGDRDMPVWGDVFKRSRGAQGERRVRERIDGLVDYLESLQRD